MYGLQRSPSPTSLTQREQTRSVPDIPLASNDPEFVNKNIRHKRPRPNDSPRSQDLFDEFKSEIREMLLTWKVDLEANVTRQIAEQTGLMTKLVSDISDLKLQNIQIQNTNIQIQNENTEIKKSITFLSEQYEDLQKEIKHLQEENREQRRYTESLESSIRDLQYKSRSSSIEVRNMPAQDNESTADLIKVITNIGNIVNFPLTASHFRDIYRIPGNRGSNKAIVAEFSSVQTKYELISRVRTYNNKNKNKEDKLNTEKLGIAGQKQAVYVEEHLSNASKRLFYLAREFARQRKYQFCWTSNGNIFLRKQIGDKQILIKSETTLKELQD
ncbi:hypothetical protein HF086_000810 [Spodoptera exigua]|uniref:FP protein C-terminal domain-containing protein n=1 Tax=Spodoptera exigua TaxID=7107 RepID=A0A922SFB2_SPOEX|nr:hypothetical protein HF086_000810 [Spodoptera exigua]